MVLLAGIGPLLWASAPSQEGAGEASELPDSTAELAPREQVSPPRRIALDRPEPPEGHAQNVRVDREGVGSESRTDYVISGRIDQLDVDGQERYELTGTERITWTNGSTDAVDELWFHVYLNAFANTQSTFMAESGGVVRGHRMKDGWGWTDLDALRLESGPDAGADLLTDASFERPIDGNENDFTVVRVPLPRTVEPGQSVSVSVDWTSRLPRVRRRTGTKDDFMLVAQWFPKLGVYESGRGWNCWQFHPYSEWYADFGTYDVSLDVPAEFKGRVFGSGVRVRELERGERVVVDFVAPSVDDRDREDISGRPILVHDFTWTADPDFVTRTATFRFAEWAERFPAEVERARRAFGDDYATELRDVTIEALIQPEREVQADRHLQATAAALFFYGLWFGEYPFERITVVDPPWGGRAAGGMEYPTIFTAGTRLFTDPSMHSPESVTIHEAGHQWFYLLSANNEFEAAWLDEGLNSFADAEVLSRVYGERRATTDYSGVPVSGRRLFSFGRGALGDAFALRSIPIPPFEWFGLDDLAHLRPVRGNGVLDYWRDQPLLTAAPQFSDPRWSDRSGALAGDHADRVDNWAWDAKTRSSHYTNTYSRTGTILRSMPAFLEASTGQDGDAAFLRAMRGFSEEWRFRHPYPDDFFTALERHDGLDLELDWFFDELFRATATIDWDVSVTEVRDPKVLGAVRDDSGRWSDLSGSDEGAAEAETEIAPENESDSESTVPSNLPESDDESERERVWDIALERKGNVALPVVVRLTFESGETSEFVWSRAEQQERRWLKVRYASVSPLVTVEVDPDGGYYLESDRSNNAWHRDSEHLAPRRWTERVFSQAATYLRWQKGLGG